MPELNIPISEQLHDQVKRRLEQERTERPHSVGTSITTAGAEAHVNVALPKQWWITGYIQKMWKGPWFGGVNAEKRFGDR